LLGMAFDPAWQLFADMVVLSADPRTVPPEQIAGLEVRATFLAGREVYRKDF
jgi:predicted amidohydrolase YtcJ